MSRLPDATIERIRTLAAAGCTVSMIANAIDMSCMAVYGASRRHGIETARERHSHGGKVRVYDRDAIRELLEVQGLSRKDAAAVLGMSYRALCNICVIDSIAKTYSQMSEAEIAEIREYAAAGFTASETARKMGRSAPALYYIAKRDGFRFKGQRRRLDETNLS